MAILDEPQGYINEKEVPFLPTVLKWGGISAAVSIIYTLINTMMGNTSMFSGTGLVIGIAAFAIGIYIFVLAVKEHRDQQLGGYISFGRAFLVVLLLIMFSTLISSFFNYIYYSFINPSALDNMMESIKETYEKMGLSEEMTEIAIEEGKKSMTSPKSIFTGLIGGGVIGAIIGVIMAAIMKKERPKFS
jgi:Protein of unknown function (DUF4199)